MHYSNLVIIEHSDSGDLEAAIAKAMGPSEEDGGFWDWYQIGGRWTGAFDGYDPEQDPNNVETCTICGGTGVRKDMRIENGCNGCQGKGERVKWPTQWSDHPGDIMPIENLTEEMYERFFRVVTPYGRHYGDELYYPWKKDVKDMFVATEKPPIEWLKEEFAGHLMVVVDNHS